MKCENYADLIHDFVENELDADQADKVSLHIFACPQCEKTFESLTHEQEIYSQFLFEIEPPKNFANRFQAKLESEFEEKYGSFTAPVSFGERLANLFAWRNLAPVMSISCLLLLIVFGLSKLSNSPAESAENAVPVSLVINPIFLANNKEDFKENAPPKKESETAKLETKSLKNNGQVSLEKTNLAELKREKPALLKVEAGKQRNLKNSGAEEIPVMTEDEKARFQELQAFEQETAKQIEKVEMLLRAFRNARFSEETEQYDVSFEKQQARKLLDSNLKLSLQAELYGDLYAKETLDKIEPFLLDIANLENTPSTAMVLDIKQRVRNENLIAGLQLF